MNFIIKNKSIISILLLLSIFLVTIFDFGLNLYTNNELKSYVYNKINPQVEEGISNYRFTGDPEDKKWAKKILNGGYLIYIRHAKRRSDFPGTAVFDLLEAEIHENGINGTRYAENDYFAEAVCLTEDGKIQAKGMGEFFKEVNFPVGKILTSPSCRARQTAEIIFGHYDEIDRHLLHTGVYSETKEKRFKDLRKFFVSIPIEEGMNTVISAHGSVVMPGAFDNPFQKNLDIEQAGMIVFSKENNILKLEHSFSSFDKFIKALYER